jgi:sugar phosphate isomerase/epimerase
VTQTDPRALGPDDLVLSHFSLARMHPIDERVRLAAANGFAGIGLWIEQYRQLEADGFAPGGLRELLDEHGVCLAEIDVVPALGIGERAESMTEVAFRMADEFGCRYLQSIGPGGDDPAATFGALCDRAADHGLFVGIEFLPFTDIVSVTDARRIVEDAGRYNGGICVDIWHHQRGANDLDAIAALPGELVKAIQMNDGPLVPDDPDYYTDCLANRVATGDGEFDVAGFVDAVRATGTTAPWSLEVCSAAGWADPGPHVAHIAAALRDALAGSGT